MSKISDRNSYNIDDLVNAGKAGWQDLKEFASLQYLHKLENSGDEAKPPLERVHLAVEDVLCPYIGCIGQYLKVPETIPNCDVILNLSASSSRTPYVPPKPITLLGSQLGSWAKDKAKLYKSLQKVTNAFAISDNYGQAFSKIATKADLKRFTDYWSQQGKGEYLSIRIEPRLMKIMKCLGDGLSSKRKCQETWWNCLWLFMEPAIEKLLEIRQRINADIPLSQWQIEILNYYISHGYPDIAFLTECDDKQKLQVLLKPHTPKMISNSPFEVMSVILLVQPAFDLAQQLQAKFPKPRFIKQCRAPSCGKKFYTGRKNATNCPGSQGHKKNKCALELVRYTRWLDKIGKKPQTDWHNPQLQEQFISSQKD